MYKYVWWIDLLGKFSFLLRYYYSFQLSNFVDGWSSPTYNLVSEGKTLSNMPVLNSKRESSNASNNSNTPSSNCATASSGSTSTSTRMVRVYRPPLSRFWHAFIAFFMIDSVTKLILYLCMWCFLPLVPLYIFVLRHQTDTSTVETEPSENLTAFF